MTNKLKSIFLAKAGYGFFVWAALCFAVLCSGFGSRLLINTDSWQLWQFAYFFVFFIGNFFILFLLPTSILFYPLARFGFTKTAKIATFVFYAVICILFMADTYVFQIFRLHINMAMIEMTLFGGGQIVSFGPSMMLRIAMIAALVIGSALLAFGIANWLSAKKIRSVWAACATVAAFVCANVLHAYAFPIGWQEVVQVNDRIPLTQPLRMTKFMVKIGAITKEQIAKASFKVSAGKGEMNYPVKPLAYDGAKKDLNVVIIYVDSLRSDMLAENTMPNLSRFAAKSHVFENHLSGGNCTRQGVFSTFYGIPGSYWHRALTNKTPSILVSEMKKAGYQIGAFASAQLTRPEFHQTVFAGVENLRVGSRGNGVLERDTECVTDFSAWIDSMGSRDKFFGFVFFDNPHAYAFPQTKEDTVFTPYWKNVDQTVLNNDFDATEFFNTYKNAVHWSDKNIRKVIDKLEAKGLLDNTIVIVSGDHGEEFNDNKLNFWGHNGNFTDAQVKVPFVVHWPGKPAGKTSYMTSGNDIAPTILSEVLGCTSDPKDYSVGTNLWTQEGRRNWVHSNGYSVNAFIEEDRIILINQFGSLEYLDRNYRESKNRSVPNYIREALDDMSRFYK